MPSFDIDSTEKSNQSENSWQSFLSQTMPRGRLNCYVYFTSTWIYYSPLCPINIVLGRLPDLRQKRTTYSLEWCCVCVEPNTFAVVWPLLALHISLCMRAPPPPRPRPQPCIQSTQNTMNWLPNARPYYTITPIPTTAHFVRDKQHTDEHTQTPLAVPQYWINGGRITRLADGWYRDWPHHHQTLIHPNEENERRRAQEKKKKLEQYFMSFFFSGSSFALRYELFACRLAAKTKTV